MSKRRGIADSVSESALVADSVIIFGNAQLLTPGNGLHATDCFSNSAQPQVSPSGLAQCRLLLHNP